jgi:hypothetical protein
MIKLAYISTYLLHHHFTLLCLQDSQKGYSCKQRYTCMSAKYTANIIPLCITVALHDLISIAIVCKATGAILRLSTSNLTSVCQPFVHDFCT